MMGTEGPRDCCVPTALPHSRHNDGTLLCRVSLGPRHCEPGLVAPGSLQPAPATSAQTCAALTAKGGAGAPDCGLAFFIAGQEDSLCIVLPKLYNRARRTHGASVSGGIPLGSLQWVSRGLSPSAEPGDRPPAWAQQRHSSGSGHRHDPAQHSFKFKAWLSCCDRRGKSPTILQSCLPSQLPPGPKRPLLATSPPHSPVSLRLLLTAGNLTRGGCPQGEGSLT